MADIEIEIDGQTFTATPNQTVIQVADAAGIYIPRFCYHKNLSIPANCRMCLVEVEKAPKPLPACATPIMPGMKIFTKSQKTLAAQRAVMEFLLINHPLDCPICDQGGECELQDLAMGYGSAWSHYDECKRTLPDQNLGPLVATDMTRCITCTRCVRFGKEVAGLYELGALGRGEHTEISTYIEHTMTSEISGNIIDLCPVGALTSKPYRFKARPWELEQAPSISPHDCLGTNINVHTRNGVVLRVVTRENTNINETWIADRDRFSYEGLYHPDRLEKPMLRINGELQTVGWEQALQGAAAGLTEMAGDCEIGALASPNSTLEEFYLLQKIMRFLGSNNIDHRLREKDTRDQHEMPTFPGLPISLAELESCETIFLIGCNTRKEQPLITTRIRKAIAKGARVIVINPIDYDFNFPISQKIIVAPHLLPEAIENLINLEDLDSKNKTCILLGAIAAHHPEASHLRYLSQQLAEKTGANLGYLTMGANAAGAWLAGAVPHRAIGNEIGNEQINPPGLNAYDMTKEGCDGYVLLNVEPELDMAHSQHMSQALQSAKFILALSTFRNPILEKFAHVILPVAAFTETSGTYVNVCGEWQSFKGIAPSYADARPAWKVLRALGNFLQVPDCTYESSEEVKEEVLAQVLPIKNSQPKFSAPATQASIKLSRIGEVPIYATDPIVRRARALQQTQQFTYGDLAQATMHPATAQKFGIEVGQVLAFEQDKHEIQLPVAIDANIAEDCVAIYAGISETQGLGDLYGEINVRK